MSTFLKRSEAEVGANHQEQAEADSEIHEVSTEARGSGVNLTGDKEMFYSHDLLSRRNNGKFSIVWLAATSKKRINRPACLKVNISQTCDDIANILVTQHSRPTDGGGHPRVKFSLYLSSLLMHGTCLVFRQQVDIFLDDLVTVQIGLSQVYLSDDGYLIRAPVKERHPRDKEGETNDEEYGKSRPKKKATRKLREAKVTHLNVFELDEQSTHLPVSVIPIQPPQMDLHLLNEADFRTSTVEFGSGELLFADGDQTAIMDIETLDKMEAFFKQMNMANMAKESIQGAEPVATATAQEPVIDVVQEQPMEAEVPKEMEAPGQATDLPKEQQDTAGIVPMETDALLMEDLAGTVAQADQNLAAPVAQEEVIAPQLEEEPAALPKETEPVPQPIPMAVDPVAEQEPQLAQPTTAQPPTSRKGKRNAVMPERIPDKRKRCTRVFIDLKTRIDVETMKAQMSNPNVIQKTMRIQSYREDIPDFHHVLTRSRPEELLGIPAIDVLNRSLKNIFQFKLQIIEKNSHASNISVVDKSRAGSETSKISFDRSRLSQHLSPMAEETLRILTSVPIPEEDLNIAQFNAENVLLQQLEIIPEIDLPAMMPDIAEAELLQISEVMPVLPIVQPVIAEEDLAREPEVVPTVQLPETDGENLLREPEVVPTAQLDAVVGEANDLALQQDYVELPIEEQLLLEEFVLPSMPVDKDMHKKKRDSTNASIDSSIDSNVATRSQTGNNLLMSLESHWSHSDKTVTFRAICHPSKTTRKQAATMFGLLLEMKKYGKVELKQDHPNRFGTIEIHPPIFNSSSSAVTTTSTL